MKSIGKTTDEYSNEYSNGSFDHEIQLDSSQNQSPAISKKSLSDDSQDIDVQEIPSILSAQSLVMSLDQDLSMSAKSNSGNNSTFVSEFFSQLHERVKAIKRISDRQGGGVRSQKKPTIETQTDPLSDQHLELSDHKSQTTPPEEAELLHSRIEQMTSQTQQASQDISEINKNLSDLEGYFLNKEKSFISQLDKLESDKLIAENLQQDTQQRMVLLEKNQKYLQGDMVENNLSLMNQLVIANQKLAYLESIKPLESSLIENNAQLKEASLRSHNSKIMFGLIIAVDLVVGLIIGYVPMDFSISKIILPILIGSTFSYGLANVIKENVNYKKQLNARNQANEDLEDFKKSNHHPDEQQNFESQNLPILPRRFSQGKLLISDGRDKFEVKSSIKFEPSDTLSRQIPSGSPVSRSNTDEGPRSSRASRVSIESAER